MFDFKKARTGGPSALGRVKEGVEVYIVKVRLA